MGKLNIEQREILTLRNSLDQSYDGIAQTLGISMGTVKSRIARARENLRELLVDMYAEFEPGTSPFSQWFESSRPASHRNGSCA